jgi:hypothetical protein
MTGHCPAAFSRMSCFWPTKTTPAPTAPIKSKIPKIVAIILPLFFFGEEESTIIGGMSGTSSLGVGGGVGVWGVSVTGMGGISGVSGNVGGWARFG